MLSRLAHANDGENVKGWTAQSGGYLTVPKVTYGTFFFTFQLGTAELVIPILTGWLIFGPYTFQGRFVILLRLISRAALFLVCVNAVSQTGLISRPPAAPDYVLQPGDQLSVHVIDIDEIPERPIRLDSSGFVDVPLAGRFRAGGLTVEQFKAALASRLTKYISAPQITAALTEDRSRPVSVVGAVNTPGIQNLAGPKRLIDVISLAGGLKPDAGSRVLVTREQKWGRIPLPDVVLDPPSGASIATLSIEDLMALKDPSENIWMEPNDIVSIPAGEVVYVVGNVKKAGGFQLSTHASISIIQALSLAEGMDKDAAPRRAKILRETPGHDGNPVEIPVDIKSIFDGKSPDLALRGNDILFVPNSAAKSGSRRGIEAILQAATGAAIYRF